MARLRRAIEALSITALLRGAAKSELEGDPPPVIFLSHRAKPSAAQALALSAETREDRMAVAELAAEAGARHKQALLNAADWAQFAGGRDGTLLHDRAERLLRAAASGDPV